MKLKPVILTTILSSFTLTASVTAGAVAPLTVDPSCEWPWFTAGSVGYLTEFEEEMYHLQLGTERTCPNSSVTDSFYLELGYTEAKTMVESETSSPPISSLALAPLYSPYYKVRVEIVPLTLNWKREHQSGGPLNWYYGAGAGVAFSDIKVSGMGSASDDDTGFYAQIFAGAVYNVSERFELFGGARYIFMDDPDFDVMGTGIETSLDGDVLFELGGRVNF